MCALHWSTTLDCVTMHPLIRIPPINYYLIPIILELNVEFCTLWCLSSQPTTAPYVNERTKPSPQMQHVPKTPSAISSYCSLCNKQMYSAKHFRDHVTSKTHQDNEKAAQITYLKPSQVQGVKRPPSTVTNFCALCGKQMCSAKHFRDHIGTKLHRDNEIATKVGVLSALKPSPTTKRPSLLNHCGYCYERMNHASSDETKKIEIASGGAYLRKPKESIGWYQITNYIVFSWENLHVDSNAKYHEKLLKWITISPVYIQYTQVLCALFTFTSDMTSHKAALVPCMHCKLVFTLPMFIPTPAWTAECKGHIHGKSFAFTWHCYRSYGEMKHSLYNDAK